MHPLTYVHLDIHKYIHTKTCMTQVLKQTIPGTFAWSAETHHHSSRPASLDWLLIAGAAETQIRKIEGWG